jgi:hypothetical protein
MREHRHAVINISKRLMIAVCVQPAALSAVPCTQTTIIRHGG